MARAGGPPVPLDPFDRAPIGVFAYARGDGTPNAVPVTPFVVDGGIVVTSTLAYVAKAAAVRRDPRVALLAGGTSVATTATVAVDPTPDWFNTHIREAEIAKFPPTRQFLGIPFHECLLPWYSARVVIALDPAVPRSTPGSDRVTLTTVDGDGFPRIDLLTGGVDLDAGSLDVPGVDDGPAVLLVHEEHADMADLRQLTLTGEVRDGRFAVTGRRGSLAPGPTSVRAQVAVVRRMHRLARANRDRLSGWPTLSAS